MVVCPEGDAKKRRRAEAKNSGNWTSRSAVCHVDVSPLGLKDLALQASTAFKRLSIIDSLTLQHPNGVIETYPIITLQFYIENC